MKSTRVVLSIEPQLHHQLIEHLLSTAAGFEIVGRSTDPVWVLATIARTRPELWIHSWEEGPELQAILSHVYSTAPDIAVVRISPDEAAGFIQMRLSSLSSLLNLGSIHRGLEEVV